MGVLHFLGIDILNVDINLNFYEKIQKIRDAGQLKD